MKSVRIVRKFACQCLLLAAMICGVSPCFAGPKPIGAILISGGDTIAAPTIVAEHRAIQMVSLRFSSSAPDSAQIDEASNSAASVSLRNTALNLVHRWSVIPASARADSNGACIVAMYFAAEHTRLAARRPHRYLTLAAH